MSKSRGRPGAKKPTHARRPGPSRSQVKRRNIVLAGLIVIAVIAGLPIVLNGVGDDDTTRTDDSEESETTTTRPPGGVISPDLPEEPLLLESEGIRSDATLSSCTTDPGTVTASGTVTNTADTAKDIVVKVSWVTSQSDVLARGIAVLPALAPGITTNWETDAELAADQPVECVLTVNRGTLQQ